MKVIRFHSKFIIIAIFLLLVITSIGQFTSIPAAEAQNVDGIGVPRTTADIMNAQLLVPEQPNQPPRIKIERELEDRTVLPQNPSSPSVSAIGAGGQPVPNDLKPPPGGPYAPQLTSTEFTGATLADTGAFPPDTMGAVGPSQFLVGVNGRIRTFNKTTGAADGVINADMDVFFASVMTPIAGTFTSDPRVRYDRFTNRWFVIMIDVPPSQADNRIMLAVSNNGTISNSTIWTFFSFQQNLVSPSGDSGCFADYPTLGIDVNALYIGTNQFCSNHNSTAGFVVQKTSILGPGPMVVHAFRNLSVSSANPVQGPLTPQGVDNFDSGATQGYFIGTDNFYWGLLTMRRVNNPGSTSPSISGNVFISVPTTYAPLDVPHLGNTGGAGGYLDAIDDRLFAAVIRNGHLWTAHNIGVTSAGVGDATGTRTAVRWYDVTNLSSTPSLVQSGTIFDSAASNPLYYWMGTVMVSGQGHTAFGMSVSSAGIHPSAATIGRLASDPLGTTEGTPIIYEDGTANYNPSDTSPHRWGDYSYTSLDPCDNMTMWTIQEYVNANNSYAVRAVKLLAPPPAVIPGGSIATITAEQASVPLTITGSSPAGQGFYDPGTGFNCRLTASATNNIIVNSVTYTNPTNISLNISTVDAATGPAIITITNPDGQQVTATITIDPPPPPANDDFANATVIAATPYNNTQSTRSATVQGGEQLPSCGINTGSTVWYKFVPGRNGSATFNTQGSNFDTVLALWTGTTLGSLTAVPGGCNNDTADATSSVTVSVTQGTTYYIQIGGINGASRNGLKLNVMMPPVNDNFANATVIGSLTYHDNPSPSQGTVETGEQAASCDYYASSNTLWYKYTATGNDKVTFSITGYKYDRVISVWTGNAVGSLTEVACDYSDARVAIHTTALTTYYIRISSTYGAVDIAFKFHAALAPSNDDFANSAIITDLFTYTDAQDIWGATNEFTEPWGYCEYYPYYGTVWYKYTPSSSATVTFSTLGSNFTTSLSVWTGSALTNLVQIGCATDFGFTSTVTLNLIAGKTYYIKVGNNGGSNADLVFNLSVISPPNAAPLLNNFTTDTPTLTWDRVSWAAEYEVQIAKNAGFTGAFFYTPGNVLSFTVPSPSPLTQGRWYWRVRARNGVQVGGWSATQSFVIDLP